MSKNVKETKINNVFKCYRSEIYDAINNIKKKFLNFIKFQIIYK